MTDLSASALKVLAWFTPSKVKSVNGNVAAFIAPYRELVAAGYLTERPQQWAGWFEYRPTNKVIAHES